MIAVEIREEQSVSKPSDNAVTSGVVLVLWSAYVVAFPFHRIWRLPWFDLKLQPPEIVFLVLTVVSMIYWRRLRLHMRVTLVDAAVAGWVVANVLALLFANAPVSRAAAVEALGALYLACVYAALRITATPRLLDRFGEWFSYSAMVAAALGIAGVVTSWAGHPTPLATMFVVPYLGHAARAQAFTAGPGMLSSILLMAVPLFLGTRIGGEWKRRDIAGLLLLVLGIMATVSKSVLCLPAALSVMWACGENTNPFRRARLRFWTASAISLAAAVVMIAGSHVMVMRFADVETMSAAQLVAGHPLASFEWHQESWAVMPTTYTFNNQASLQAIVRNWPGGVGPAGQPAFTATLQQEGRFPRSIWMTTPHSTYLGTAAERGVVGFAVLVVLLAGGGVAVRQQLAEVRRRQTPDSRTQRLRWEIAAYAGAGAAFLIEALSTDLLNCRHYWLLLAVIVARCRTASTAP